MSTEKRERLKIVLDAYGADPARWPDAEREALSSLLDNCAEHDSIGKDADEIDQILAAANRPAVPQAAIARLAGMARATPQAKPAAVGGESSYALGVGRFAAASTLAASLLVGVYMGTLGSLDSIVIPDDPGEEIIDPDYYGEPFDLDSLLNDPDEGNG